LVLLDLCFTSQSEIEYALNIATHSVDIIYLEVELWQHYQNDQLYI
jgi:hypothetical protein